MTPYTHERWSYLLAVLHGALNLKTRPCAQVDGCVSPDVIADKFRSLFENTFACNKPDIKSLNFTKQIGYAFTS